MFSMSKVGIYSAGYGMFCFHELHSHLDHELLYELCCVVTTLSSSKKAVGAAATSKTSPPSLLHLIFLAGVLSWYHQYYDYGILHFAGVVFVHTCARNNK